jgi:hypothetical protein
MPLDSGQLETCDLWWRITLYHVTVQWQGLSLVNACRTVPASMCVVPTVKFWWGGITAGGCFSWNGHGPFVILHGNINTEGYKDILSHCILSTVEDQLSDDDCQYQHDSAPCHKARSVREWFVDNKVPEMDWPAQSPDMNSVEHLWDELERRLCSRPQHPTSLNCSTYSCVGRMDCHSIGDVQIPGRKSPQKSLSCHKGKGWAHPVLMSTTGKCVTGKVGLQFWVGVRILLIR